MQSGTVIVAESVEKVFGYGRSALKVLKGVSLEIKRGEIISIVGPSGAGKSTLLNIIGCLDSFQAGKLTIMGIDVTNIQVENLSGFRNRHLGFIFQLHNLLPEFTALENIMIPLLIRRTPSGEARRNALALLDRFNLSERANHRPGELSGGECQRIAVARAIVTKPDIILADEPTGSLDSVNSRNLSTVLMELGKENGTTIVIVTHDQSIASMTEKTISLIDGTIESVKSRETSA